MTRDDIIRMARDAGFVVDEKSQEHQPNCIFHTHHMVDELLERFAALVEMNLIVDGWRQCAKGQRTTQWCSMVEAEREACAELVEGMDVQHPKYIAAAIRERGKA